jgi:peroxiredoxin
MSLKKQLAQFDESRNRPPEITAILKRGVEAVRGPGTAGLPIGETAPDFTLPNQRGDTVRLADRLSRGPVVLSFYRGVWWPYCNLELAALAKELPVIRSLGADLMAISPELPDNTLTMAEKHAIPIDILSDATSEVLKKYRLWFAVPAEVKALYLEKFGMDLAKYNGEGRWELPVPATYVLDRDGIIRAGEADPDYTVRMEPSDILSALRDLAGHK